ncbi:MAG: hypothetical protein P8N92_05745 [Burkholderiales bacterium]|nr:hypothetical protein [Burkholderiales bacterium]
MKIKNVALHLLRHCGSLIPGERLLIICDDSTRKVSDALHQQAISMGVLVKCHVIPALDMHGCEPPSEVALAMRECDLIIGVTRHSMAHTKARIDASKFGARYLSLADYSMSLLEDPSLTADFRSARKLVDRFADSFSKGSKVRVQTRKGTDVLIDIGGRLGNACPGYVVSGGDLGSPPDIEANVSPIETGSNGFVLVDGSIPCPEIGMLSSPVGLFIKNGSIVEFEGASEVVNRIKDLFSSAESPKAYVLAECGVGLNNKAQLTGSMLTDEGAMGTMHFGFGSNITVGGLNDVSFHLDFVFRKASLSVDGTPLLINGEVV